MSVAAPVQPPRPEAVASARRRLNRNSAPVQPRSARRRTSMAMFLSILPFLVLVFLFSYFPLYGWVYALFDYGAEPFGGKQVLAIGSKAEDPQRVAAFIDWLYSAEGTYSNNSQTMGAAGPQGLTWDVNADGKPELTEFGMEALVGGGATVPEEWGGGTYEDGASWLNTTLVLPIDTDEATGAPFSYKMWETFQAATTNPLIEDWSAQMGGAPTTMDYLKAEDKVMVAPGASYTAPADSSEIETLRNQVKAIIVQESWKMSFASSDAEFESLLAGMQETAKGLGYDQVLEVDMANAKEQDRLRQESAAGA